MNTSLAITISPKNRVLGSKLRNANKNIFDDDTFQIKQILKYNRINKYIIFPEFDDKGRLHYHGILSLDRNQYIRFYKHALTKLSLIGFVDVKKLKEFQDKLKWLIYCKKEWNISSEILEIENPIWNDKVCNLNKKNLKSKTEFLPPFEKGGTGGFQLKI